MAVVCSADHIELTSLKELLKVVQNGKTENHISHCRGLPPAMETGILLDTTTALSPVRSQWTKGKTVSPKAMKDKLQTAISLWLIFCKCDDLLMVFTTLSPKWFALIIQELSCKIYIWLFQSWISCIITCKIIQIYTLAEKLDTKASS